jgi:hypothetical protein
MSPDDPHYWERQEAVERWGAAVRIDASTWKDADFWELFEAEANDWITSQPVADVIPLLRCLINKYWHLDDDAPPPGDVAHNIHCLLYYAWDRAREAQSLRRRVRELEIRLLSFARGHS